MIEDSAIEIFYPSTREAWRGWLQEFHLSKQAVWVVFHKKSSDKASITWTEAVEEALCFGWIDSKKVSVDAESSHQFFSKRKAKGTWSKINKDKVELLIANGQMTAAGLKAIALAKENGSWTMLDDVEKLVIPEDLIKVLKTKAGAEDFFLGLSKSVKKAMLQWIMFAKRTETREKRILEIAELAAQGLRPTQFR